MKPDRADTAEYPDELPEEARPHWPDLNRWPTPADVNTFRKATRGKPHIRLAVLNGLRSWSAIDISPVWAWAGALITVALTGLGTSLGTGPWWLRLSLLAAVVVFAVAFLSMMIGLSTGADKRRRRAHIWLHALESAL